MNVLGPQEVGGPSVVLVDLVRKVSEVVRTKNKGSSENMYVMLNIYLFRLSVILRARPLGGVQVVQLLTIANMVWL